MKHLTANLALTSVSVSWGLSYPLLKIIGEEMPPFSVVTCRFLLTSILMFAFFYKKIRKPNLQMITAATIGGILVMLMVLFILCAVKHADASTVGFLISSSVAFVIIINVFIVRQLPSKSVILGLVAVLSGLYLLSGTGGLTFNLGAMFALLAAIVYAIDIHLTKFYCQRIDTVNYGVWKIFATLVIASIAQVIAGEGINFPSTTTSIISMLVLAGLCSFYCFSMQVAAQKYTSAQETGLIFTIEPVASAIYACIILGEVMSARSILGAVIVLGGVIGCMLFSNWQHKEKNKI